MRTPPDGRLEVRAGKVRITIAHSQNASNFATKFWLQEKRAAGRLARRSIATLALDSRRTPGAVRSRYASK